MSFEATTTEAVVGVCGVLSGFGWMVSSTRTNATMARKIPMSRTNRFERFK
jgi:hypothetical protein